MQRERAEGAGKAQKYEKRKREGKREKRERKRAERESRGQAVLRRGRLVGRRVVQVKGAQVTVPSPSRGCVMGVDAMQQSSYCCWSWEKGNARTESLPRPMYAYVLFPPTPQGCLLAYLLLVYNSYIPPLQESACLHPSSRWGV